MAVKVDQAVADLANGDSESAVSVDQEIKDFAAKVDRQESPVARPLESARKHITRAQRLLGLSE